MFARQTYTTRVFDFSRFVDTEFAQTDPCLNCSLWKCDESRKECQYVQITGRRAEPNESSDEQLKRDLMEILLKLGEKHEDHPHNSKLVSQPVP